jgi:glyoxylate/hydroxypyruvate reductase A
MSILIHPSRNRDEWLAVFQDELPDMDIFLWPDVPEPETVEFVVASRHDVVDLRRYPNLRAVLAMGAGIEQYMSPEIPDVPVVRLADPAMSDEMAAYVVHWVVHYQKRLDVYIANQAESLWREEPYTVAGDYPVGILGFGTIGRHIGHSVADLGFPINAWSRTGTDADWATSFNGLDQLDAFLEASSAVVNVLPHTADTDGLLNAARFDHFRPGSLLINLGRGATTNEADLFAALRDGRVGHAVLDVTNPEPLASDSPLWTHPGVRVTPHVSGFTLIRSASRLIADNIRRMLAGEDPFPVVDTARGY